MIKKIYLSVLVTVGFLGVLGCSPSQDQVDSAIQKEMQKREDEKKRIFGYIDQYVAERGGLPGGGQRPTGAQQPPQQPSLEDKIKNPKKVDIGNSPSKGYKSAKVTIVEFSDFQCPFCTRVNPTIDSLMKKYAGKVKLVFKNLPLPMHPDAKLAAQAGLAAHKQDKFWQMHDKMFENQTKLKKEDLMGYAKEMGLDQAKFKKDLEDPKIVAAVEKDMQQAQSLGVNGTPAFYINGVELVGAQPEEEFSKVIDALLGK
ncbi:MAG: DsbA family protein [Oligoflexia bacterium]|nr:DsbA family protein [Oligoflexia bacterium]